MTVIRNYALAVVFITAAALTIAAGGHPVPHVGHMLWVRGSDTVIGCVIGLVDPGADDAPQRGGAHSAGTRQYAGSAGRRRLVTPPRAMSPPRRPAGAPRSPASHDRPAPGLRCQRRRHALASRCGRAIVAGGRRRAAACLPRARPPAGRWRMREPTHAPETARTLFGPDGEREIGDALSTAVRRHPGGREAGDPSASAGLFEQGDAEPARFPRLCRQQHLPIARFAVVTSLRRFHRRLRAVLPCASAATGR